MSNLYVEQRIANEKKSEILAYVLWFFLGWFGVHRMYLGRWATGVMMTVLALGAMIPFLGLIPLVILGIWWFLDLFLTHAMIDEDVRQMRRSFANDAA